MMIHSFKMIMDQINLEWTNRLDKNFHEYHKSALTHANRKKLHYILQGTQCSNHIIKIIQQFTI